MESTVLVALLGTAGMIGCLYFAVKPLWPHAKGPGNWRASTVWADWLDRKKTLLFNLEDLAHEQRLGKISGEDFSRLETSYKKEFVALLDLMENSRPPADFEAFLLGGGISSGAARSGAALPPRDDASAKACFRCKVFYGGDFSFCPKCGAALAAAS